MAYGLGGNPAGRLGQSIGLLGGGQLSGNPADYGQGYGSGLGVPSGYEEPELSYAYGPGYANTGVLSDVNPLGSDYEDVLEDVQNRYSNSIATGILGISTNPDTAGAPLDSTEAYNEAMNHSFMSSISPNLAQYADSWSDPVTGLPQFNNTKQKFGQEFFDFSGIEGSKKAAELGFGSQIAQLGAIQGLDATAQAVLAAKGLPASYHQGYTKNINFPAIMGQRLAPVAYGTKKQQQEVLEDMFDNKEISLYDAIRYGSLVNHMNPNSGTLTVNPDNSNIESYTEGALHGAPGMSTNVTFGNSEISSPDDVQIQNFLGSPKSIESYQQEKWAGDIEDIAQLDLDKIFSDENVLASNVNPPNLMDLSEPLDNRSAISNIAHNAVLSASPREYAESAYNELVQQLAPVEPLNPQPRPAPRLPPVVRSPAPPPVAAPLPAGVKGFNEWSGRAAELGWSPGQRGQASYQGYLSNLGIKPKPKPKPKPKSKRKSKPVVEMSSR